MAVVTEEKTFKMVRFESIIKRCPFCLKDTQQDAYYAEKPDLSVEVQTKTNPPVVQRIAPKIPHQFSWDVMGLCSECNQMYRIMGIPKMKVKEIPPGAANQKVMLGLVCCDVCDIVYSRYKVGEIFIRVKDYGSVYLCEEHSEEVELKKGKSEDYDWLVKQLIEWKNDSETAMAIKIDGEVVIVRGMGYATSRVLQSLKSKERESYGGVETIIKRTNTTHKIEACIEYLKGIKVIEESSEGIMKKKIIKITELGTKIAASL